MCIMVKLSVITLRTTQSTGKFLEITNSSAYILPSSGGSVIFNGLALGYAQGQVPVVVGGAMLTLSPSTVT